MDDVSWEFRRIYYDPGTVAPLEESKDYSRVKELGLNLSTRNEIENFLRAQHSYTLHKPRRKTFTRNRTRLKDKCPMASRFTWHATTHVSIKILNILWLVSMFLLNLPGCCQSKKSSSNFAEAFRELFKMAHPRKPKRLPTDRRNEFLNQNVKNLLKTEGIELFQTWSDKKQLLSKGFIVHWNPVYGLISLLKELSNTCPC